MHKFNGLMKRIRVVSVLALLGFMTLPGLAKADTVTDDAVSWIISKQIPSTGTSAGAYQWDPADPNVYANTQGATALGVLRAYQRTGNLFALASAQANGDCQVAGNACIANFQYTDGDHRFATHDALFLIELSRITGDPQYAGLVDADLWAKFAAGTYGATDDMDAADFAAYVLVARTGQNYPEIVAFDLSKMAIAAHLAGESVAEAAFMAVIDQSLEGADATHQTFDLPGLAGAIWASSVTGIELDPSTGTWSAANSTADLAAMLATYQAPNGGFIYNTSVTVDDANVDLQMTAFSMQALHAVDPVLYQTEITQGFAFITSTQALDGHFGTTYVEGHGEVMEAYADIILAPTDVYVDDDYAGDAFGDAEQFTHPLVNGGTAIPVVYGQDAFASIAEALEEVAVGGNVYVASGHYVEGDTTAAANLVIDHPVNLFGAQAGIDARNRSDTGASIIVPAVANPTLSYASAGDQVIVSISSDNVIVDGFVLDGDNPVLSSGVIMGAADPDVDAGLYATGSHIDISNNVVRNLVYAGVYSFNYPTSVPAGVGNVIRHNWVYNIDAPSEWGIGIAVLWNYYADIDSNLLDDVRIGIQTNYFFNATADPATDARVRNNEIHASAAGIYDNYFTDTSSSFTLSGNQIFANANPAQDGLWVGFVVQGLYEDSTAIIQNNQIDGSALVGSGRDRAGYRTNLITTTQASNTAIDGGNVSHVDYGVLATDGAFYEGGMQDLVVRNIAFSDVSLAAFYVEDTALAGTETTDYAPKLTIGSGNSYTNVAYQGALAGPQANIAYEAGAPMLNPILVRAENAGHRPGLVDSHGNVRHVDAALINSGIGFVADAGTVNVEAGDFAQNVIVDKGVSLLGPFAGVTGYDVSRDGTGEAVISPATGRAVRIINASNVLFDGFTIQNVNDTAISSGANYGGPSDHVQVVNNRVIDVHDGSGLYTNGPAGTVANWTVAHNLMRNIESNIGSGINLWKVNTGVITDNVVEDSAFGGIQINTATDVEISGNTINNTAFNGINVGASSGVQVFGNTITNANTSGTTTEAGLTLYGGSSNVDMFCNSISGAGINGFSTSTGIPDPYSDIRVFDNAITVTDSVSHNLPDSIVIGSNWYGGSSATTSGGNAAGVQLADPLPATPIGTTICNNPDPATANDPVQLLVVAGSGQSTPVDTSFGQALEVRVTDALGGAVMGANVNFAAPASGASAVFATVDGTTDFNGMRSTAASANSVPGGYAVTANSGTLTPVSLTLLNTGIGSVTWANLTFTYDGNTHAPSAFLTEEAGVACTVVPAMVGPNAGATTVTATCDGVVYDATGDATATITPAPAVVTLSNLNQVFDGSPKSVTVTTTPASVTVDVTYDGSTTAPSAVGDYAVEATVSDPNYTGSASATLHIVEADAPNVSVTITDDREYVQFGELLTYTITVNNLGNTAISGGTISNTLPPTLLAADPSWTCVALGTATCAANGNGALSDTFNVPAGGGVVYLLNAWVNDDQSLSTDLISNTVTVTAAGDVDTSNDSATDLTQAVIFRDGFENGGDGAEWLLGMGTAVELGQVDASRSTVLDLVAAAMDGYIVDVANVRGSHGDQIAIQAVRLGKLTLVRLSGYSDGAARFTHWTIAEPGLDRLALGLVNSKDGHVLLLVGGAEDLQLPLSGADALGVTLASPSGD